MMDYLTQTRIFQRNYIYYNFGTGRRPISTSRLKECHKLLEVTHTSTPKEIKESFLRLSKIYHPDNKLTGSHTKFVQLKAAFDEIKEAPTASASDKPFSDGNINNRTYSSYGPQAWSRAGQDTYGFGGPYARNDDPWERVRRDRAYRRQTRLRHFSSTKPAIARAITWILIWSSLLIVWDLSGKISQGVQYERVKQHREYLIYQDRLREKRVAAAKRVNARSAE